MNKKEARTAMQMRTFAIFKAMPKYDLKHLYTEMCVADDSTQTTKDFFDTHVKRAAALTATHYRYGEKNNSLTRESFNKLQKLFNK